MCVLFLEVTVIYLSFPSWHEYCQSEKVTSHMLMPHSSLPISKDCRNNMELKGPTLLLSINTAGVETAAPNNVTLL